MLHHWAFEITQGLFMQKATHDFDYMSYLVGSPIVRVAAMATFEQQNGQSFSVGSAVSCGDIVARGTCSARPTSRTRRCASTSIR